MQKHQLEIGRHLMLPYAQWLSDLDLEIIDRTAPDGLTADEVATQAVIDYYWGGWYSPQQAAQEMLKLFRGVQLGSDDYEDNH